MVGREYMLSVIPLDSWAHPPVFHSTEVTTYSRISGWCVADLKPHNDRRKICTIRRTWTLFIVIASNNTVTHHTVVASPSHVTKLPHYQCSIIQYIVNSFYIAIVSVPQHFALYCIHYHFLYSWTQIYESQCLQPFLSSTWESVFQIIFSIVILLNIFCFWYTLLFAHSLLSP